MRSREFAKALAALAEGLERMQPASTRRLREVLPAFNRTGTVIDIIAKSEGFTSRSSQYEDSSLTLLADDVETFASFYERACKPSFRDDAKGLVKVWRQLGAMSIRDFVETLQSAFRPTGEPHAQPSETLVDAFVRRLNETKHDPSQFPAVVSALEGAKELKRDDVVAIASRFAYKMSKSTSKAEAVSRIRRQHESSELAGAKDRATRGTSAA